MRWCDVQEGDVLIAKVEMDKSVYIAVVVTKESTKWFNALTGMIFFTKRGSEQLFEYTVFRNGEEFAT